MIEYRSFHNTDPPRLIDLWNRCPLGRGAASNLFYDAFERVNLSQPYFDRNGLITARDGERVIGFVHAGFGPNNDESLLSCETGVICIILVDPQYRRQGIGRELVARAETYLRAAGAETLLAGAAEPCDPFYFGLYGGSRPVGFLESDADAKPFFEALGYEPWQRWVVYHTDLQGQRAPVSLRLMSIRRKMQLAITHHPENATWWWMTRYGRLDSLEFCLVPKNDGDPVAQLTVVGLDFYMDKWQERAVGLSELEVSQPHQRQGYGQALVVETCRRLREELVTRAEASVPEANTATRALLESAGFQCVDHGVVYRRT